MGLVSVDQAMYLAHEKELDLVQVNSSNPPVAKIMDYGKYRYAQEKQESRQKVKSRGPEIKEIRLSLKIDKHDLDFKTKQAQKFLADGDKVKVSVKLMGREMMFSSRVKEILESFAKGASGEFEGPIERMGSRFSAILRKKPNETKNS